MGLEWESDYHKYIRKNEGRTRFGSRAGSEQSKGLLCCLNNKDHWRHMSFRSITTRGDSHSSRATKRGQTKNGIGSTTNTQGNVGIEMTGQGDGDGDGDLPQNDQMKRSMTSSSVQDTSHLVCNMY